MKLQLKHLAPYLPYKLNCLAQGEGKQQFELQGISDCYYSDLHEIGRTVSEQYDFEDTFPILRPLSDLKKGTDLIDFESEIEQMYGNIEINHIGLFHFTLDGWTTWEEYQEVISKLFEWHFDVFGLIEKGLAIDINTLSNN
jgi:hypothetical protein